MKPDIKDKEIRKLFVLRNKEFFNKGVFLNEYNIGHRNRADLGCYKDGFLFGFEIKSCKDNTKRLPKQMLAYNKFFDFIYVVVFENHIEGTTIILNKLKLDHVGIIKVSFDKKIEFENIKEATLNPNVNKITLLGNLWRCDLMYLMDNYKMKYKNYSGRGEPYTNKHNMVRRLFKSADLSEIKKTVGHRIEKTYGDTKCIKCRSNLTFNTSSRDIIQEDIKNKILYSKKTTYRECFECGHQFDFEEGLVEKKKF